MDTYRQLLTIAFFLLISPQEGFGQPTPPHVPVVKNGDTVDCVVRINESTTTGLAQAAGLMLHQGKVVLVLEDDSHQLDPVNGNVQTPRTLESWQYHIELSWPYQNLSNASRSLVDRARTAGFLIVDPPFGCPQGTEIRDFRGRNAYVRGRRSVSLGLYVRYAGMLYTRGKVEVSENGGAQPSLASSCWNFRHQITPAGLASGFPSKSFYYLELLREQPLSPLQQQLIEKVVQRGLPVVPYNPVGVRILDEGSGTPIPPFLGVLAGSESESTPLH